MKRGFLSSILGILCFLNLGCHKDPQTTSGGTGLQGVPIITTDSVNLSTPGHSICFSTVTSAGDSPLISRGVCWDINPNPVPTGLGNANDSIANSTGPYQDEIPNLAPNQTYYLRAYAHNNIGTGYGNQIKVTIPSYLPVITSFSPTSDTLGGILTVNGNYFGFYIQSVEVGSITITSGITAYGDTAITFHVPANSSGQITITNEWGTITSQGSFTYVP
jgi:hypothetical protein